MKGKLLKALDFFHLKKKAYIAAKDGVEADFTQAWEQAYLLGFQPTANFFIYKTLVYLYKKHLLNPSEENPNTNHMLAELEGKFNKQNQFLLDLLKFVQASEEGSNECPLCGDSLSIPVSCQRCGIEVVN